MVTLDKIFNELNNAGIVERYSRNIKLENVELRNLSYNSNNIIGKTLFICKGATFKPEYLIDKIDNGIVAYISEKYYEEVPDHVAYIIVKDIREAMSIVSNTFYDYAWKKLTTIGLTGTKGKTTTTYYIKNVLERYLGESPAIISTIETYTGITNEMSKLTTPESPDLHRYFYEAVESKLPYVVMEVASQGYKVKRVNGIKFDIGVFLNIAEDHISEIEHPDFEDYFNCKLELMKNCKTAIINKNMDFYEKVKEVADNNSQKVITYGTDSSCDYYIHNVRVEAGYNVFDVVSDGYYKTFRTKLLGRFNIENALVAIIVSRLLNVPDDKIFEGIEKTEIEGRMNIFKKDEITVIVDFAHNKLSYQKLYESIKLDYPKSEIISVGGCVGSKAYNRRKDFGDVVGKYSDYIYLTEDDPGYEEVIDICNDMASYLEEEKYEIIEDRKEAVLKALTSAKAGDVVVLLSKGHETSQKVRGRQIACESDITITKKWIDGIY